MSSKFKTSKYKHTTATTQKKELWYPDIKPAPSSDYTSIAASARYIAVAWANVGTIALFNLEEVGKRSSLNVPLAPGHSGAITDLAFSPYDDSLLASSGEDGVIKFWTLPQDLNVSQTTYSLSGHSKRVECLRFHPVAKNVLASGSADKTVKLWDVEAQKEQISLGEHTDSVQCIDFNWNGSLVVTVSKDKKLRIFDARANKLVQSADAHQGVKPSRVVWLGNSNRILTTGFSKSREREYIIWDSNLKNLERGSMGSSTGVVDVFFDPDSNLAVLAGKGDGSMKLLEIGDSAPFCSEVAPFQSDLPQMSITVVPKRACDLMNTEIIRVLKLTANAIVPVSYSVPRKAKSEFQEDLYPPTKSFSPALTAQEWFAGETKDPLLVKIKPSTNKNAWWETSVNPSSSSSSTNISVIQDSSQSSSSEADDRLAKRYVSDPNTSQAYRYVHKKQEEEEKPKPKLVSEIPKVQVVRSSKYRHINVKTTKKELWYDNLRITAQSNSSDIKVNNTFFCVTWQGSGGNVAIIPTSQVGKLPDQGVPFLECGSPCLDFDFNPFRDHILATVNENSHLQIWKIPEGGLQKSINQPDLVMKGHTRRVTTVDFHPFASNVVLTTSNDGTYRFWDIEEGKEQLKVNGPNEMTLSNTWNWNGSILATSCKDKYLRTYDPRANKKILEFVAHDGAKGFKCAWVGHEDKIISVGFNRSSQREILVWDLKNTSSPFASATIDNSAGLITPYYDDGTGVLFLPAKGEGNVKMYEFNNNAPYVHFLTEFRSTVPGVGYALLPKTSCDVKEVEIAKFFKLCTDHVEPLSFRVPRTKMEFFQDDVFPDTRSREAVETASEWFSGVTREPIMVSLRPEGMPLLSEAPVEEKVQKYTFDPNKKDDFSKEKFLQKFGETLSTQSEASDQVLVQDKMQGADASEWED